MFLHEKLSPVGQTSTQTLEQSTFLKPPQHFQDTFSIQMKKESKTHLSRKHELHLKPLAEIDIVALTFLNHQLVRFSLTSY